MQNLKNKQLKKEKMLHFSKERVNLRKYKIAHINLAEFTKSTDKTKLESFFFNQTRNKIKITKKNIIYLV